MEAIYYDQNGETLEFKSDGRVIVASERIGRYTREGATITATDNDGEIILFIADIKNDLLVPQERSRMKDVYMIEKAYKEKLAELEAAHKRFVEMIKESAKPDAPQSAAKELGIPVEKSLSKSGIILRLIPAGEFIMGSPKSEGGRSDGEVQHAVRISKPFYIGKYEVTQGQWQKVMGNKPSEFKEVGENVPVEQVSWNDCQEFLRKLEELEGLPKGSIRLPTEAEWEYACRAGTQTAFCYGDDLDSSMANFDGNYGKGSKGIFRKCTMPVGSFKPNAWGLYDMHGNVWEWCQDRYGPYDTDDAVDPRGANSGSSRVVRGGSWYADAGGCRSALRCIYSPDDADSVNGFRLSLPAGQ
jgi:formylglycine-generating enzyme required for sulfatase activity